MRIHTTYCWIIQTLSGKPDSGNTVTGDIETIISTIISAFENKDLGRCCSYSELSIGAVQNGQIISTSVSCDIGFTSSDLDFCIWTRYKPTLYNHLNGTGMSIFSFEDTCGYSWEYQTGKIVDGLIVDNMTMQDKWFGGQLVWM